jgi:RNA-directed DNA polymerase
VEPVFHRDSYGYRPGRSALDAVGVCRERCWRQDWVLDLDLKSFSDTVPWDLVVKAVEAVTDCRWGLLYIKRWLAAPLQRPDGTLVERDKGTPQGSAISPILANLFMHYAFDSWMARNYPRCPFERYADDAVVHCKTRRQAELVRGRIAARLEEVGLRLHPDKTRIVYCKDSNRREQQSTSPSPSSGSPSGHGRRGAATACGSRRSCQRSAPRRSRPPAPGSADCGSTGAQTCRSTIWRDG